MDLSRNAVSGRAFGSCAGAGAGVTSKLSSSTHWQGSLIVVFRDFVCSVMRS